MTQRWDVGILGATGMVGQHLVKRLEGHPWFRLTWVAAILNAELLAARGWLAGGVPSWS